MEHLQLRCKCDARAGDLIEKILARTPEGVARIRLGRGVVGNTTYAFWATCAVVIFVAIAMRGSPGYAVLLCIAIMLLFLMFLAGTYWFADRHPDRAMLGDAEWLQWHQSQLAGKDLPHVPAANPVLDPTSTLPTIEHKAEE